MTGILFVAASAMRCQTTHFPQYPPVGAASDHARLKSQGRNCVVSNYGSKRVPLQHMQTLEHLARNEYEEHSGLRGTPIVSGSRPGAVKHPAPLTVEIPSAQVRRQLPPLPKVSTGGRIARQGSCRR